ncbi:MAG: hypothetical protein LKJ88_08700 [Bacilli bacterium]|jgi:hypothetical protein|nr:hypothetical protein [Bacilli bacterium]
MKYFVNYTQVFGKDESTKRESLRLQSYNMLIHFLTRKQIEGNVICYEFNKMKAYFESKDFTNIYFLSPYIFNQTQFVKDMMEVITSSGETNRFNKIFETAKEEIKMISTGRSFQSAQYIKVDSADEYLAKYMDNPHSINQLDLEDPHEREVVMANVMDGYLSGNEILSVLYFKLLIKYAASEADIKKVIRLAEELASKNNNDLDLFTTLAKAYNNQYYQEKDKNEKVFYWYQKASCFNDPDSLYMLGLCYFLGIGALKDRLKAVSIWKEAAQMNNSDAASGIGVYYLSIGDKTQAKPWLVKSAAKGDYKALLLLDTDFDRK